MAKRSKFDRIPKDLYTTSDPRAFKALSPHLPAGVKYVECCAGPMELIIGLAQLRPDVQCVAAYDAVGWHRDVTLRDATLPWTDEELNGADMFITNPPWTRKLMHAIIVALISTGRPVWLLFDADWAYTQQAIPYLQYCSKIVSIGRLKWFKNTKHDPMDNAAWYCFELSPETPTPLFYGRTK